MLEIWQADAQGRYAHPRDDRARPNAKFKGFGRSATDKDGIYSFDTVKPGAVAGPGGQPQAPHIVFCIFSRGMLRQIYTRLYFSGRGGQCRRSHPDAGAGGPARDSRCPQIDARRAAVYRFDIRVQGENETVFFDI